MKLLIIPVVPPSGENGGNVYQLSILEKLRHQVEVTLVYVIRNEYGYNHFPQLQKQWPNVKIIPLDVRIPEFKPRFHRLRKLVRAGINTFRKVPVNGIAAPHYNEVLRWKADLLFTPASLYDAIQKIIETETYDLVQIEFFEFLPLVDCCRNTKTVFVHPEPRFQIMKDLLDKQGDGGTPYSHYLIETVREWETRHLSKYDRVIIFTPQDELRLREAGVTAPLMLCPFPIPDELVDGIAEKPLYNKPVSLMYFLGAEAHLPNRNGLMWFFEKVFNKLDHSLHLKVVGKWSEEFQRHCREKWGDRIVFTGYVENLEDAFTEPGILINPIFEGAGLRTKVLCSFAMQVPVVSTSKGCEGIGAIDEEHILFADDDIAFVKNITRLSKDLTLYASITKAARQLILDNFTPDRIVEKRMAIYRSLLKEPVSL